MSRNVMQREIASAARFMALILALLFTTEAGAEWTKSGEDVNGTHATYLDLTTLRRSGPVVKLWMLYDFTTPHTVVGRPYRSVKLHQEYDCQLERYRMLAYYDYAGPMGEGGAVYSYVYPPTSPHKWVEIMPGSLDAINWRMACGKK